MRDVIGHADHLRGLPARPMLGLAEAVNRWRYGYAFAAVQPVEVVKAIAPRPLLIIHGAADRLIPLRHALDIFAAAADPKELWVVEGVGHCGGYFADRPAYVSRVAHFFERHLAGSTT